MPCARGSPAIAVRSLTHEMRPTLQEWLLANRERFVTFMLEEIVDVAIASGYPRDEVNQCFNRKDRRYI